MARVKSPFLLYKRSGSREYTAKFLDPATGDYSVRRTTGKTRKDRAAIEAQRMLDAGEVSFSGEDELVVDFLRRYWMTPPAGKSFTEKYRADSLKMVETVAKWAPLAKVSMPEITIEILNRLSDWLLETKKPRNVQRHMQTITAPLRWAKRRGYAKRLDLSVGIDLPRAEQRDRGRLTIDEVRAMLDLPLYVVNDPRILMVSLLGTLAGLRKGEIRGLRWRNVDLEAGTIRVDEQYTEADGFHAPKTAESARTVVMVKPLADRLSEYREWSPMNAANYLVVFGMPEGAHVKPTKFERRWHPEGETPIAAKAIANGWPKILAAIGIDDAARKERNLPFHSTRHTFASLAAERVNVFAAMRLTGHTQTRTLEGYAKADDAGAAIFRKSLEADLEKHHG